MNENILKTILQEGEGYTIEFKRNFTKEIDKEMVSFANSSGGQIFIGIDDGGKIVGTSITNDLKSKIYDLAQKCDPPIDVKLETFKNILIVHVKEGENKPYKCSKGFYLRVGANSQKMSRNQIMEFMKAEGRIRFDELVKKDIDLDEHYSPELLRRYLKLAGISNILDDKTILQNLGVLQIENGKPFLNNAGILFFAKDPCTIHLHYQAVVTCALFKGTEKVDVLDRKDLSADIITNIEDALIFLKKHLNLRYEITSARRREILEIPESALREAVVNAVCHRDYFEKGANTMIEIYDDRVEISNPGGLPKPLKPKDFGKKSVTRNPIIADLLHRAGYIEKMGTGIMRMRKAMKEAGLEEPLFEYDGFFTVTFKRPVALNKIRLEENITELEKAILNLMMKDNRTTLEIISQELSKSRKTVQRHIKILEEMGIVAREGSKKKGYWKILKKT